MLWLGSASAVGSTERPFKRAAISAAVGGMICMRPTASAGLSTAGRNWLSSRMIE